MKLARLAPNQQCGTRWGAFGNLKECCELRIDAVLQRVGGGANRQPLPEVCSLGADEEIWWLAGLNEAPRLRYREGVLWSPDQLRGGSFNEVSPGADARITAGSCWSTRQVSGGWQAGVTGTVAQTVRAQRGNLEVAVIVAEPGGVAVGVGGYEEGLGRREERYPS